MVPSICWLLVPLIFGSSKMHLGPNSAFQSAILDVWRDTVAAGLCAREGFRGGLLLDIAGTSQLLKLFPCSEER